VQGHVPDIDNVKPKMQDDYVSTEVNLPYQGTVRANNEIDVT
jgi:hypothetical protein